MSPDHCYHASNNRGGKGSPTVILVAWVIRIQIVNSSHLHSLNRNTDPLGVAIRLEAKTQVEAGEVVV